MLEHICLADTVGVASRTRAGRAAAGNPVPQFAQMARGGLAIDGVSDHGHMVIWDSNGHPQQIVDVRDPERVNVVEDFRIPPAMPDLYNL